MQSEYIQFFTYTFNRMLFSSHEQWFQTTEIISNIVLFACPLEYPFRTTPLTLVANKWSRRSFGRGELHNHILSSLYKQLTTDFKSKQSIRFQLTSPTALRMPDCFITATMTHSCSPKNSFYLELHEAKK